MTDSVRQPEKRASQPRVARLAAHGGLVGLRALSSLASLIMLAAFARTLETGQFTDSQAALIGINLITSLADMGISLAVTRATAHADGADIPRLLGLRMVTLLPAFSAGAFFLVVVRGSDAFVDYLAVSPYAVALSIRSHAFAQIRAHRGMHFELAAGPAMNTVESLTAAAVIFGTRDALTALLALSIMGLFTVLVACSRAAKHAPALSVKVTWPWALPWARILGAGLPPLIAGLVVRLFALVFIGSASLAMLSEVLQRWCVASLRIIDAIFVYATSLVIMPRYIATAKGERDERSSILLLVVGISLAVAGLPVTAATLGAIPRWPEAAAIIGLGTLAATWFIVTGAVHAMHARGQVVPPVIFGVTYGLILLLPVTSALFRAAGLWSTVALAGAVSFAVGVNLDHRVRSRIGVALPAPGSRT